MAIYDAGTASLAANGTVTGVGTTWMAPLTLIRVGATIVFKTEPVKIYTISEIISDTQINVYNPNSETIPAGTGYAILAHDGITVQGLAQDVAETLRYYQSRETEVATAVDVFKDFDQDKFSSDVNQVNTQYGEIVNIGAQVSADASQVASDKDAAAVSAASASSHKDAAAASAQEAADYAASLDTSNLLRKDLNFSDVADKQASRENLDVYSKSEVDSKVTSLDTSNLLRKDLNFSDVADKSAARTNLAVYSKDEVERYGVRLSDFSGEDDPINSALNHARTLALPVIIDVSMEFTNPIIMYDSDRIYCYGKQVLTKVGNATPSPALPEVMAPARNSRMTDFNVDAAIIIVHPENGFGYFNKISGLRIETRSECRYAIYAPFFAHNMIEFCSFYGFKQAIRTFDCYAFVWNKVYANYWYSTGGQKYSEFPAYHFEDPEKFTSGTSGTMSNVTAIFYSNPWRLVNREYTTMNCCGAEGVDVHSGSTFSGVPYVFSLLNCNAITINSPYTENNYAGFFSIVNNNQAVNRGGSIVINTPQATSGVRGTRTDVGAALFDVSGEANVLVNGGFMVTAASGYYLKAYKCSGDSYLKFNGTDMRYLYSSIASDTASNDGVVSIDSTFEPSPFVSGLSNSSSAYTGVVPYSQLTGNNDRYGQNVTPGFFRTALPGIYEVEATVSFYPTEQLGIEIAIKNSATASDSGSTLAVTHLNTTNSGRSTYTVRWRGRLPSNRYIYVATSGNARQTNNKDTTFSMRLL